MSKFWFCGLSSARHGASIPSVVLFLCVAGCEAKVDPPAGEPLRGAQCAEACELQHPLGVKSYRNLVPTCACTGCSSDCSHAVCPGEGGPAIMSDECLPCVQNALSEHCDVGFFEGCWRKETCAALAQCVIDCPLNVDE